MVTEQQIINKAREYLGTPFHSNGRLKGIGVDCTGLIVCVLRDLGEDIEDFTSYSSQNHMELLLDKIKKYSVRLSSPREAAFVVFSNEFIYHHICIDIGNGQFIHANNRQNIVMIDCYKPSMTIHSVWRYKNTL